MQFEPGLMEALHSAVHEHRQRPAIGTSKLNVLVLYAESSCFTATVLDHLLSFKVYTDLNVYYADAVNGTPCNVDLEAFDAVVMHYSTGLYHPTYFSPSFESALRSYSGLKVAFAQDEYDWTETLRARIQSLGIHVFYTCVPEKHIEAIYPKRRFGTVRFINSLTGYVPIGVDLQAPRKPMVQRRIAIGYRGRPLHPKYGLLCREKLVIGQRMKGICERERIPYDIAWKEESRIYWSDWYRFLEDCKVTLGTESGSNVFDFDGSLRKVVDDELRANPDASFDEVYEKHVAAHEGRYGRMNQISPRIFEAMALRTGLVLFEGEYSGIIKPDVHYIPLRKDFGNIDEVLRKIRDDAYLEEMTERAFNDIIAPGRYTYAQFARSFEQMLHEHLRTPRNVTVISSVVAAQQGQTSWLVFPHLEPQKAAVQASKYLESLSVFPVASDPVKTATNWPLFNREHSAITQRASWSFEDEVRNTGRELLSGVEAELVRALRVQPRGFGLLLVALASFVYPVWRRLPEFVRWPIRKLARGFAWLMSFGTPHALPPPKAGEPNSIYVARDMRLNRFGTALLVRVYPIWQSLPHGFRQGVKAPATAVLRAFRAG